jgi:hypothetical protein
VTSESGSDVEGESAAEDSGDGANDVVADAESWKSSSAAAALSDTLKNAGSVKRACGCAAVKRSNAFAAKLKSNEGGKAE